MRRPVLAGMVWAAVLGIGAPPAASEDITLTTYYPSPRGVYKELRTTGDTFLATQAGGNVGIGTITPLAKLQVHGDNALVGEIGVGDVNGNIWFDGGTDGLVPIVNRGSNADPNMGKIVFYPHNGILDPALLTIQNDGNVGVGPFTTSHAPSYRLHVLEENLPITPPALLKIEGYSNVAGAPVTLALKRSRGTLAAPGDVRLNDSLGQLVFKGWSVSAEGNGAASIGAEVDGPPGPFGLVPGRLVFSTNDLNSVNLTERMRITSEGNVGVGTPAPLEKLTVTDGKLMLDGSIPSVDPNIGPHHGIAFGGGDYYLARLNIGNPFLDRIQLGANDNVGSGGGGIRQNFVVLHSNGNVGIGVIAPQAKLHIRNDDDPGGGGGIVGNIMFGELNKDMWYDGGADSYFPFINGGVATGMTGFCYLNAGTQLLVVRNDGRVIVGNGAAGSEKFVIENGNLEFVRPTSIGNIYVNGERRAAFSPTGVSVAGINSGKLTVNQLVARELKVTGSKQFVIQHPLHPNQYLAHASIEGPENGVFYRGEARLADGRATIQLPDYFEALTRKENRTVLVTAIFEDEEPVSSLAASRVVGGRFTVRAADERNPSQAFTWEVKAVRADIEPLAVEVDKPAAKKSP